MTTSKSSWVNSSAPGAPTAALTLPRHTCPRLYVQTPLARHDDNQQSTRQPGKKKQSPRKSTAYFSLSVKGIGEGRGRMSREKSEVRAAEPLIPSRRTPACKASGGPRRAGSKCGRGRGM